MQQLCTRVKAVIFDLDGTLLDTLADLADAGNAALLAHGLPAHDADAYRLFVGDGMETLMRRAAPEGTAPEALHALVAAMRAEYARNWARKTTPYSGIVSMLDRLCSLAVPIVVLSNKPHDFALLTVSHFFPAVPFARVQGSPAGGKAKPDPALALDVARSLRVQPEDTLFVGDSSVDMDTATAAGMVPAGVLWGFRTERELLAHGARHLLADPGDIFACL